MSATVREMSATGRRKTASARVWIREGTGRILVNQKDADVYFCRPVLIMQINQPLQAVDLHGKLDIHITAKGGGLSGQAGAVRHGIARALCLWSGDLRPKLKRGGFLTRDSRMVERKKYGRPGARRRYQFSKR